MAGIELSENANASLVIPAGFGHAFQSMTDNAHVVYFHSESYDPNLEGGLNALDSDLNIEWPFPVRRGQGEISFWKAS